MRFTNQQILAAINDPGYRGGPREPQSFAVAGGLAVTVGANNPFVIVRPAKNVVLEINLVTIIGSNSSGAASEWLKLLTGRTFDAFAGLGGPNITSLTRIQGGQAKDDALGGGALSTLNGNSTTTATNALSGSLHRTFAPLAAHIWSPNQPYPFVRPIVLFGDDPAGASVLGCFPAGNLSAGLSIVGREWPYDIANYI